MNSALLPLCERYVQVAHALSNINELVATEEQIRRAENEKAQASARLGVPFVPTDRPNSLIELLTSRNQLERQLASIEESLKSLLK